MRYYNIAITGGDKNLAPVTFTSFPNNQPDPCALDLELDISVAMFSVPAGQVASFIQIYGVSLDTISQSPDFNNRAIEVSVGMQAGLPLANAQQSGQVIRGTILQCFGNWIGVDQTICFYLGPPIGSNKIPLNIVLNWRQGTQLSAALVNTLTVAFPGFKIINNIKTSIVQSHDEIGHYYSVTELASRVKELSASIVGASFTGVEVLLSGQTFTLFDGTSPKTPKQINYQDLVGQPTWQEPQKIQITTVMRADISSGDIIQLPNTLITATQQNLSQYNDRKTTFQGKFTVQSVRHVGRFRQPDANSWLTLLDCYGSGSLPS